MHKFARITATAAFVALSFATASTAEAIGSNPCPRWVCGGNGTSLDGINLAGPRGTSLAVTAVILPTDETMRPLAPIQLADNKKKPKPQIRRKRFEGEQKELDKQEKLDNFGVQETMS